MTLSAQRPPASVGSKIMLAMLVVLAATLAASLYGLWMEKSPHVDLTGSIESGPPVNVQATFSYTLKLAKLVEPRCGSTPTGALHAASKGEITADPSLEQQVLAEATKRAATITTVQSCDYVISEIQQVETRAAGLAKPEH